METSKIEQRQVRKSELKKNEMGKTTKKKSP